LSVAGSSIEHVTERLVREELEAAVRAADAAYVAYAERVCAERRELFPGEEQVVERAVWPREQQAELERLRDARTDAYRRLWAWSEAPHIPAVPTMAAVPAVPAVRAA
jgi:hypothetical protein